jgi:alpha-L-arabinofuranosidase
LTTISHSITLLPAFQVCTVRTLQTLACLAAILYGNAALCFAQRQTAPTTTNIRISANKPAPNKVPRSILGTFLEPIGNSIYGGLWAEILENPSFEDNLWSAASLQEMFQSRPELIRASELTLPLPWEPLNAAQGARYAPEWNDAANSSRSLLLIGLPDQQTGVRQRIYLPVHRTLRYSGSIYLKHLSGPPAVEISIRSRNQPGEVLVSQTLSLSGTDWRKYDYSLDVPEHRIADLEPADYVIAVSNGTRVLLDQASLLPADNISGMDPDMVAMARDLKSPIVRFGGNFTSAYHWKDGIGPLEKRRSMLNSAWGMPEYNQFGTDEFLRFCELVGAEPQIALNLGTGTPEEAAAWVEYVNAHWGDHHGGLLWELGNELWGTFQIGYPTLPRVADRTKAFSEAVRKVDPNSRLIATGADPDNFHDWNEEQLKNAQSHFQFLSTHFVVTTSSTQTSDASADFIAMSTFALPVEVGRRLRKMHEQFQNSPGEVKTAFTEWLFWAPNDTFPRYDNMGGAVATGGFLNMFLRNSDIVPIADMTGIVEFGGIWKKRSHVFGTPAYWVFKMYSTADFAKAVEAESDGETYDVASGTSRFPSIEHVPYLDVVATLNEAGDKLTVFCVNRELTRDLPAKFEIAGFRAKPNAVAHSVYADSIYEKNDEMHPEQIHPRDTSFVAGTNGFNYVFRHASVTVVELHGKVQ